MRRNTILFISGAIIILFLYGLLKFYPESYMGMERYFYNVRDMIKISLLEQGIEEKDEIVIVDVDDKSLKKLGRYQNWPRYYFGKAITDVASQEPLVIGVDFIFAEKDSLTGYGRSVCKNHLVVQLSSVLTSMDSTMIDSVVEVTLSTFSFDSYLSSAMNKSGNVILASYLTHDRMDKPSDGYVEYKMDLAPLEAMPQFEGMVTPTERFLKANAGTGVINSLEDPDGVQRKASLFFNYRGQVFPSFPVAVAREAVSGFSLRGHRLMIGGRYIWLDRSNYLWINYQGDFRTYKYVSFVDLLEGRVSDDIFKNKIVLFGSSSPGIADLSQTPFQGLLPSVEVHANVIHNLLFSEPISKAIPFHLLIAVVILVFLVLIVSNKLPPYISPIITLVILGGYFVFSVYQYVYNFIDFEIARPLISIILSFGFGVVYRINILEREKREIRDMFSRYVPEEVVNDIIRTKNFSLQGERREISVLISDIRGFTSRTESESAEEVVDELNEYFEEMAEVVFRHGGMIDKYMGDGIMCIFGAPIYHPAHADRALSCAVEMQRRLKHINTKKQKKGEIPLKVGIAVNTGEAIIGNIGSSHRADYTAIGDVVNTAARLEPLNKEYRTEILMTETLLRKIKGEYKIQSVGKVNLKGKKEATTIYAVSSD